MESFDLAQSFIERTAAAASPAALAAAFQDTLERLGFRYFACLSHVDPLRSPPGAVVLQNYPDHWVRAYSERRLREIDPVLLYAERSIAPFHWDSPRFQSQVSEAQREILVEAVALGLHRGYTVPIHLPWSSDSPRASCSVVPDSDSIDAHSYFAVQLTAMHLYVAASGADSAHSAASPQSVLSVRERQCLEVAAQGKSDWAIGQILRLSASTVHGHLERAKRRLGVATRVQAVIRALQCRQISFGDVIRAERTQTTAPGSDRSVTEKIETL